MKTLRQLSKYIFTRSLIIFFLFFSNSIAEDEPIDIWKIEKQENVVETNNETVEKSEDQFEISTNSNSNQDIQIISNTSLDKKDLIVGLYDPSENGLRLDMWMKSDGNDIKNLVEKINTINLSTDAKQILEIVLLTNSQIPNKNINEKEFIDFKIDYLIKNNNNQLIIDYLEKNESSIYNTKLIRHYVDEFLIANDVNKSCELINKVDIFDDKYLGKFKIYCLLLDGKREEAQLIYDLFLEKDLKDNFFEDKFFFLMGYKSDVNTEISEKTILDFHLSHKVSTEFEFQPKKETPKFIWRYLSNANLLQNTELIDLDDFEKISLIEQATHDGNYDEDDLFKLYMRFQFNIKQLLNAENIYKDLNITEGRALIYQKLLLSNDTENILKLSKILKDSFKNNELENAFNLELKNFLEKIDIIEIPSDYSTFYSDNIQKKELIKKNIKINNKIIHQSKLLNYLNGKKSIENIDKDLIGLLKSVKKNKDYLVTTKDLILMESLISDGVEIPKKYQSLFEFGKSNIPTDIQLLISNEEIGLVLLRLVELIGRDNIDILDPDTLYFIATILNALDIDQIRNYLLLKVLPLKV